LKARGSREIGK
jgi:hypothetical protein